MESKLVKQSRGFVASVSHSASKAALHLVLESNTERAPINAWLLDEFVWMQATSRRLVSFCGEKQGTKISHPPFGQKSKPERANQVFVFVVCVEQQNSPTAKRVPLRKHIQVFFVGFN